MSLKKLSGHKVGAAIIFAMILTFVLLTSGMKVSALSGGDWQSGAIISDSIFFNKDALNVGQIQTFMNAKVPTCDTNGAKMYSSTQTRAQYGASKGSPAPYTCLKDYSENTVTKPAENGLCSQYNGGTKSSAQIIYDVSQACGVSPAVLLVLLQKEQSLLTDEWPWPGQYRSATGFGCPDTAACDSAYYGFFNQVYNAARIYKKYARDSANYNYRSGRNNTIQYNPNGACGSSNVYIQNQATAGLYIYTPYQPNRPALDNLYGNGDSCSAYGNRNFWRLFNDWFGATSDGDTYFSVTNVNPENGANLWYLITPTGKYYIPSMDIYYAWGLDRFAFQTIDRGFFSTLADGGSLGRSLKDKFGNSFFIDGGQTHYIRDKNYYNLWNLGTTSTVQSTGLVYALRSGNWVGRFMTNASNGEMWLMDGGTKHRVPANTSQLYQWRYTPDQNTTVTATYLNTLTAGADLDQQVSQGSGRYVVDSGRVLYFDNGNVQDGFASTSPVQLNYPGTLDFMPKERASVFAVNVDNGAWYMIEGRKRHYISRAELAYNWGYQAGSQQTLLSSDTLADYTESDALSSVVQSTDLAKKWVLDGAKHAMTSANVINAWVGEGVTLPTYSAQSLGLVPTGGDVTTLIQPKGQPYVYTMDNGSKRFLPLSEITNAWGNPVLGGVTHLSTNLTNIITEASAISCIVKNGTTNYLLMDGTAYPIDPAYASSWGVDAQTPVISNRTFARFNPSSQQLGAFVKINGKYFIMRNLTAIPVSQYADAYDLSGKAATLPFNYFATTSDASYLIGSTDSSDTRVWMVSGGKKLLFQSFAQQANYGYVSQGVPITRINPSALNAISDSAQSPSLLITKQGAGVKQLSFGYALSFPDGPTLTNYVSGSNPILTVSASIYDSFLMRKDTSRLIRDDDGKIYYIENGAKRWILNGNLLNTMYKGMPITYLEGTAVVSIPAGANLN